MLGRVSEGQRGGSAVGTASVQILPSCNEMLPKNIKEKFLLYDLCFRKATVGLFIGTCKGDL
jgi:hypothetical protein